MALHIFNHGINAVLPPDKIIQRTFNDTYECGQECGILNLNIYGLKFTLDKGIIFAQALKALRPQFT